MESKNPLKVSLCITVLNEEASLPRLLESIASQSKTPDEVILVDGGSTDKTVAVARSYLAKIAGLKILTKKGNRAISRNEAIKEAKGEIIAITDAGCELDKQWLEEITKPFKGADTQVVSGYYAGRPKNAFEASLVPYVLVMPDRAKSSSFLPSTRSAAMLKAVWEKMGGFPTAYRWNEDYVFSKRLEKAGINIVFAPKAIVYWFPRKNLLESWKMFYAFARGDAQAGIWRPKVILVFLRYAIGVWLLFTAFWVGISLFLFYLLWAIWKNYRYVKKTSGLLWLPFIQCTADSAIIMGTVRGIVERMSMATQKE